jgi:hypothetical protein
VDWVWCEGLSGSCYETVTGVKPPYRTRSQSRISSLATIARRIADDRAEGARSVVVFGCAGAGDAARLPAARIHDEGERDDDRFDQVYDDRFVSAFPAVEAGHRQQTDELAHEHRGVVVQDELLVVGAGGRGHDRGDDQKARPRDGS